MEANKITEQEGNEFCETWEIYTNNARGNNITEEKMKAQFVNKLKDKFGENKAREIIRLVVSI